MTEMKEVPARKARDAPIADSYKMTIAKLLCRI